MSRRGLIALLLVIGVTLPAYSGWKQVHRFSAQATCAYFFDPNTGLVGFGSATSLRWSNADIELTTDGGLTWTACKIPSSAGRISSIFMQTNLVGYASVMYNPNSLWTTTDGGRTWNAVPGVGGDDGTCVYATSRAIVRTCWSATGGSSTNNGAWFSAVFASQDGGDRSNGIDFLDDLNGIVTMGPDNANWGNPTSNTYYTTNGGVTWTLGGIMHESWGIYAQKATGKYFSMAEDDQNSPGNTLYWTQDGGKSWKPRYGFQNAQFTGHIAGAASVMYVQTSVRSNIGLYRSDDNGLTWHNVGGPSNDRDTRFFVTGCRGEVVYAFDNTGGIWRTTDGGDGTMIPAPYIGDIPSVGPGSEVLIPIYYDTLPNPAPLQELSGTISLNDDLLTPDSLVLLHTQFDGLTASDTLYATSAGQWTYDIKFKTNTKLVGSTSLPLLLIRAKAFVTDTNVTDVLLGTVLTINGGNPTPLVTCSGALNVAGALFTLRMSCGDTTLYQVLRGMKLGPSFSVRPNPARDEVRLSGELPVTLDVQAVLYNAGGEVVRSESFAQASGHLERTIATTGLPSGTYLLRVATSAGTTHTIKVAIDR